MKIFTKIYDNRKRAVSPVIAVILLIGLAVAAAAAIFIVVIPLLEPTASLEIIDGYVVYDADHTSSMDEGVGYGMGYVELANVGTGEVDVNNISIYYRNATDWVKIPDSEAWSMEEITTNTPWTISVTQQDLFRIRFHLPDENINDSVAYKITVTPEVGQDLDTTKSDEVEESDMELTADRPQITYTRTLGTIRRTYTISPTAVIDNSNEVKNVTYEVFKSSSVSVFNKTITSSTSWPWQWNTYNSSNEGLNNSDYKMRMTVYDYAGLSDHVWVNDNSVTGDPFTIDNDYVDPNIISVIGSSTKGGEGTAEVGEFYSVSAEITDSGSGDSEVESAYIHYKTNSSSDESYATILMTKSSGNTWIGNIPASFIDSDALANNLAFNISASDKDANSNKTDHQYANVEDTTGPDFTQHIFEGESITSQTSLEATEGYTLSLSVTVEDEDQVTVVNLVWRERNETGVSATYGPWQVLKNISGTGDSWDFRIPAINVSVDGLEYYFNATDPTNNTGENYATDGSSDFPYRISIPDETSPTISFLSSIPATITEGIDLVVSVSISDNDPSFSWTGSETGTVKLGYRKPGELVFTYLDMSHTSGDSSIGETAIWGGTVGGGNFSIAATPVVVEVLATDNNGQSDLIDNSIDVSPAGTPLLVYVADSGDISGASDHELNFDVKNEAGDTATANITDIQVELVSNDKTIESGLPYIIEIAEAGTIWQNQTNTHGANNTKLTLDSAFLFAQSATKSFTLTYANSSGGYYDLNDLTVIVTLYYDYGPVYGSSVDETLDTFNTPTTQLIPQSETRHLLSGTTTVNTQTGYQLGTSLTGSIHLSDGTTTYSDDLSAQWGIRVYILHSGGTLEEITSGTIVATVSRSAGGDEEGLQTNSWGCPYTPLATSDAIWIEVRVQVGSNSEVIHANFVTEALGAESLDASTWQVYYYTERDRGGGFWSRTTTAYFHWGSGTYDSRIEGFKYSTIGGGGGSPIMASITSVGGTPTPSAKPWINFVKMNLLALDISPNTLIRKSF